MANLTDYFIKGSENEIGKTLLEAESAITISPTEISIHFYLGYSNNRVLEIRRTPTGDGITYASGRVGITPAQLTETLSVLLDGRMYRAVFVIKTATQPDEIVFGGDDSENKIWFLVSSKPVAP